MPPRSRWQVALTMVLLAVALLWPAAINRRPAYFFDSAAYLSTGTKALRIAQSRIEAKLDRLFDAAASDKSVTTRPHGSKASAKAPAAPSTDNVVSIRAIAYSLFVALAAAPGHSMWLLIAVNAIIVTLLVWEFWRVAAPAARPRDEAIAAFFVATATSAPWFVSYAMPDLLAGASILAMIILTFAPLHQQRIARTLVAGVVVFAVAAHASHIPIIGLIVAACVAESALEHWRGQRPWSWERLAWIVVPFVAGIMLVLLLSLVSFGSTSVAPKRLPFALAQSIDDGPGRWYLEETCATKKWTVCPYFYATGRGGPELIFSENGLIRNATPAQMEAIRRDEMTIVRAATLKYPAVQIRAAIVNTARQFFRFGLEDNNFAYVIVTRGDGDYGVRRETEPADVRAVAQIMVYGGVGLALVYLLTIVRSLTAVEAGMLRLVFAGLLANAMVTGILSTLTSRYQSRVIWVVLVVALGLWLARRSPLPTAPEIAGAASPARR